MLQLGQVFFLRLWLAASRCCPGQEYRTFHSFSHTTSSESKQWSLLRLQPVLHRKQQRLSSTCLLPGVGTQAALLPVDSPSSACSEQVQADQRICTECRRSPVFLFAVKHWLYFKKKQFYLNVMQHGEAFQIQCHFYSLLIKVLLSGLLWGFLLTFGHPQEKRWWWRTLKTWLSPSLMMRWSSVKDPLSFFPFNRKENVLISSFNSPLSLPQLFNSY